MSEKDNNSISDQSTKEKLFDRMFRSAFMASICFLCVFLGLLMAAVKAPPFYWTDNAFKAFNAICIQQEMFSDQYPSPLWQPIRYVDQDVTTGSTDADAITLFTAGDGPDVKLVDSQGNNLHTWNASFSSIWGNQDFMKSIVPDERIFVRRAHVFSNGDLLALYETPLNTPNGMGFARLDRNSNVVWSFDGNCHHDFTVGDDGKIFVLTHQLKASDHPKCIFGTEVNIEDFLTILSSDGKPLKEFSLLDAFFDSPFYRHYILQREHTGDLLHANTVNFVQQEFASHYDEIDAGDVMVCYRNLNLVVVVDPENGQIVWGTSGPWHFPHDPDPLANGNILIFDNCVCDGLQSHSRIVEFDPRLRRVVWSFKGDSSTTLRSDIRSSQQRLANGNTLIGESNGGRILEVDADGNLVWQFVNPTRGGKNQELVPIMTGVERYQRRELPFIEQQSIVAH